MAAKTLNSDAGSAGNPLRENGIRLTPYGCRSRRRRESWHDCVARSRRAASPLGPDCRVRQGDDRGLEVPVGRPVTMMRQFASPRPKATWMRKPLDVSAVSVQVPK
jgi:hypothetical protein